MEKNKLSLWLLEDDEEYGRALESHLEAEKFQVSRFTFVEPMYKELIRRGNYPDGFIIDLVNAPSYLRGRKNILLTLAKVVRFFANPLYFAYFDKRALQLQRILENRDSQKLADLSIDEIICWPWGGLQFLALLADKKLLPLKDDEKKPVIIVNSIMDIAAEFWGLKEVSTRVHEILIPLIDKLLREKFRGSPVASELLRQESGYLAYIVKGSEEGEEDETMDFSYVQSMDRDVVEVKDTVKKILLTKE